MHKPRVSHRVHCKKSGLTASGLWSSKHTLCKQQSRALSVPETARVRDQSTNGFLSSNKAPLFISCQLSMIKAASRTENRKDFFQCTCIHGMASFSLNCFSDSDSCTVSTDSSGLTGADLYSHFVFSMLHSQGSPPPGRKWIWRVCMSNSSLLMPVLMVHEPHVV